MASSGQNASMQKESLRARVLYIISAFSHKRAGINVFAFLVKIQI